MARTLNVTLTFEADHEESFVSVSAKGIELTRFEYPHPIKASTDAWNLVEIACGELEHTVVDVIRVDHDDDVIHAGLKLA